MYNLLNFNYTLIRLQQIKVKRFFKCKKNGNWHDLFYFPKCFTCYGSTHSMENDIHTLWVENNITNLLTIT